MYNVYLNSLNVFNFNIMNINLAIKYICEQLSAVCETCGQKSLGSGIRGIIMMSTSLKVPPQLNFLLVKVKVILQKIKPT